MIAAIQFLVVIAAASGFGAAQPAIAATPPKPLMSAIDPEDWVFAFKLNASTFPTTGAVTNCLFGGTPQPERSSQQYSVARSSSSALVAGPGLLGTSLSDPVGATFNQIYHSALNFVVWNDQFYRHPNIQGCAQSCGGPWGHSKGMIAWDNDGNGLALQVTTPSWPGSGTDAAPRAGDGNTLGCIESTNNVLYSQHFFALRLA
ncbi:deoxyribonuclease II family protein, partial [Sphingomonas sp.]|uniref:deoxyribonuclease II family protein n=1 Tax=Sphingomonas sp. TaxID=28214 RepID=UPI00286D4BAB